MNDFQRAYHELEMMQELDMLEKGTNICEIVEDYAEGKQQPEVKENTSTEIENQMVVGEYYTEEGEQNE
jgi:hypothetical protein